MDFSRPLRGWDGFGVNYVEAAQTRDYKADPQEYGGMSTLPEADRQKVLDLVFGAEGLRPGLLKMFLDCWHQPEPGPGYDRGPLVLTTSAYDHESTTKWMRLFAREGLARTRARGGDLAVIVTLYGPPAWMTRQKFVRGRDLDPAMKAECAKYMVAWAKFLRESEGLPVRFISLHNEGEDWTRWPADGSTADSPRHDYNLYWPPEQVVEFLKLVRRLLDAHGMNDVGVTPGETTNWYRFAEWGYARAVADDAEALRGLGLITSHGFFGPQPGRWFGDWRSAGVDILREKRPELHAWVTSTSWRRMDVFFVNEIRSNIYSAKVNGLIPWAAVQQSSKWVGGDPNPGTAVRVDDAGRFKVEAGYHFYKQVSRAGQPGMAVAEVQSNDSEAGLIGFAARGTKNPDAVVVLNLSDKAKELRLEVRGTASRRFMAWRTSPKEQYAPAGEFEVREGFIGYAAPGGSVTTFFGR
ncbi:MAG: hypothetical protein FJ288_08185 [Planctomycetes bacterium]|nr:hypothetical protein [Planctomycetota bacterium]